MIIRAIGKSIENHNKWPFQTLLVIYQASLRATDISVYVGYIITVLNYSQDWLEKFWQRFMISHMSPLVSDYVMRKLQTFPFAFPISSPTLLFDLSIV